jgi:hypothetical protein
MSSVHAGTVMIRRFVPIVAISLLCGTVARAQDAPPPAYLAVVEGAATLERDGEVLPATQNMPFVTGDRLRTANGRVEIVFPDGSAIEVGEYSEVESISPSRVRLIAGTMDHLQREISRSTSASYLPQELDTYGTTLDQNGAWQYAAPYGYVWYPTVAPDWRPYYNGYWSPVRTYGWTWVGLDTWAWPTHHYGRWGHASNRWFWIPGRTWGPAWVSWAAAADYVSWCPLGFDSRPVFALSVGHRNTWAGWTVLPRSRFGVHQYYANRYAVDARRIPVNTPFIAHHTPALPRQSSVAGRQSLVGSRQSPVDNRQPPVGSRQAPVDNRQSPVGSRQAPVDSRQASAVSRQSPGTIQPPVGSRQAPIDGRQQPADGRWSRNPQSGVQTHYGIAVPRTTMEAPPVPDYRPVVPERYRPAVPEYRSPNGYQIQRMDPRVISPAPAPATPPPNAAAPSAAAAPAPVAVPRAAAPGVRPGPPPPQATPHAAPPARSAPAQGQGAPQGEARPRGEGRPAEGRRPR